MHLKTYRTPVGDRLQAHVRDVDARLQIDGDQLGAVLADRVHGHIGDLLAVRQVQLLDVVTMLRERPAK